MVVLHIKSIGITKCRKKVANILSAAPRGQKLKSHFFFSEQCHVAYQIRDYHECSSMVANVMPADALPLTLGMGSIGQNSTFLKHGHVAYQIKGNHECTNMVANILPADAPPPRDPWDGVNR